jgi:hypothetical protein
MPAKHRRGWLPPPASDPYLRLARIQMRLKNTKIFLFFAIRNLPIFPSFFPASLSQAAFKTSVCQPPRSAAPRAPPPLSNSHICSKIELVPGKIHRLPCLRLKACHARTFERISLCACLPVSQSFLPKILPGNWSFLRRSAGRSSHHRSFSPLSRSTLEGQIFHIWGGAGGGAGKARCFYCLGRARIISFFVIRNSTFFSRHKFYPPHPFFLAPYSSLFTSLSSFTFQLSTSSIPHSYLQSFLKNE